LASNENPVDSNSPNSQMMSVTEEIKTDAQQQPMEQHGGLDVSED
jgi:hypothetical protein